MGRGLKARCGRVVVAAVVTAVSTALSACGGAESSTSTSTTPHTPAPHAQAWREVELDAARATGPLVPDGGRGVLVPADRPGPTGCLALVSGGQFRGCLEDEVTEPHPIGRPLVSSGENILTADTRSPTSRLWVGGAWGDGGSTTLAAEDDPLVTDGGASDDDLALMGSVVTRACPGGALAVWMPLADDWRIRGGEDACVSADERAAVVGSVRDGAVLVAAPDVRGRPQAWLVSTDSDSWDDATWQRVPLPRGMDRVTDVEYTYTSTLAGTRGGRVVVALDGAGATPVADEVVDPANPKVTIADDGFVDDPVLALQGPRGPRVCRFDTTWTCVDGPRGRLTGAVVSESLVHLSVRDDDGTRVWQAAVAELFDDRPATPAAR